MPHFPDELEYSDKYYDSCYEYRHVALPEQSYKSIKHHVILEELVWRNLGVQQSRGWEHYAVYEGEPYILLFRRPLGMNPNTGEMTEQIKKNIEEYEKLKKMNLEIVNPEVTNAILKGKLKE